MLHKRIWTIGLIIGVACSACAASFQDRDAEPLKLHPDHPHYFLFRGKPTVLIASGEHYGAVLNQDFDYLKYLETLQAEGMNLTRTVPGTSLESTNAGTYPVPRGERTRGALAALRRRLDALSLPDETPSLGC